VYKEIFKIIILFSLLVSTENFSQEKELFDLIITDENATPELLPERIIFTQKIFWGENGILRKTGIAPLNLENREKELNLRRSMLKTHQILGYFTLGAMVAQGFIGGELYNATGDRYNSLQDS
jgi:hypothetical protein